MTAVIALAVTLLTLLFRPLGLILGKLPTPIALALIAGAVIALAVLAYLAFGQNPATAAAVH